MISRGPGSLAVVQDRRHTGRLRKRDTLLRQRGWTIDGNRRVILVYIDYQSVCPFVGIGSPSPPPQAIASSPWTQRGGKQHSLAGEGVGGTQFGQLDRKPDTAAGFLAADQFFGNFPN